jgi:hypothetical protein
MYKQCRKRYCLDQGQGEERPKYVEESRERVNTDARVVFTAERMVYSVTRQPVITETSVDDDM